MLRERTDLAVGYSGDWGMAAAMLSGADAFYSVLGGILPAPVVSLAQAARAGDSDEAERPDAALAPLWKSFKAYGSLRVMYVLLDMLGLGQAVLPRPILPLEGETRERVVSAAVPLLASR
ncbi:dihydrodipicolinate synthase family protein [Aurantimonas sp. A2-1-M11]|uniref:dihydrodipicolinate synthase family protein n=1 Tax=Aurantimonas sp. A2-1-M11 TaxID=3113712 RepID=UPI002F94BDB0